jgi:2-polyprenyl-6-methoxyphenol hydroxylase-like FAD-dependent oxidoreductase
MNVLISGAGIAGSTLAFWLKRHGCTPTLLEEAQALRTSGYVVDFWGQGFDIAEKMGLIPELVRDGYRVREVRFVDNHGQRVGGFSVEVFNRLTRGRYVTVARSRLAEAIYASLQGKVETIFGERVCDLKFIGDDVQASFLKLPPRRFDLVIGADGLHSNIRQLLFDAQSKFETYLGYKVATFEASGYRPRDELTFVSFSRPGLQVSRFAMRDDRTLFLLIYADKSPKCPAPSDITTQKRELHARFDGQGWECARILSVLDQCQSVYFDRVSQIRMPNWFKERAALVGDAAAAPSLLAGQGAALAMMESYVLAGELARSPRNPSVAFARYDGLLHKFVEAKQIGAERLASSFAPRTELGLLVRNLVTRALGIPFVADWTIGPQVRDDINLPAYETMSARAA